MSDLKITGNPTPMVGVPETYSIVGLSGHNPLQQAILSQNPSGGIFENQIKWTLWILENGIWKEKPKNAKTGATVTYTFSQQSLKRRGIRLKVETHGETATITIKTKKGPDAKIIDVVLLDAKFKKPTKPFAYGDSIIASVHCVNMDLRMVKATLWEDDAEGKGHNSDNTKIQYGEGPVKDGRAYIKFLLSPNAQALSNSKLAAGDQNEGKTHEYYITAEVLEKAPRRVASKNTNVANPDYKPEEPKQTPAQQKGPSKKEERGILDSAGAAIHDYYEKAVTVMNEMAENAREKVNSLFTVEVFEEGEEGKKEKLIIFPLLVKPENDDKNKWVKDYYWGARQRDNMTTFNSNRTGGRKHAARDLYTNPYETVVAIADGEVLDIRAFYDSTDQITIRHKLKDGRDFIIRYGELDPRSIVVKIGDMVTQKMIIGKTGKLMKNPTQERLKIGGIVVYMLHFEHFSGSLNFNLSRNPLSDSSIPYKRRSDLIDSLAILQEGYRNTFGNGTIGGNSNRINPQTLNFSQNGLDFLKGYETEIKKDGKHVYFNDDYGYCTIGFGHLIEGKKSCESITIPEKFKEGLTDEEANTLLFQDVKRISNLVKSKVTVNLHQHEFDALVSLAFNVEVSIGSESTLLRKLNTQDYEGAADEFKNWRKAGGVVSPGLVKRRAQETDIFKNNVYDSTH